jgi:ubiquinone/menaquinone biosynthesis C-methylase UbiE
MIDRARRKAKREKLDVRFEVAWAQALSFPAAASFDVVLSTVMLHHIPRAGGCAA